MKRTGFSLVFLCIMAPSLVLAQGIPGISEPLSITVIPTTTPAPGTIIYLQAGSSSFDIDTAYLTWTVNGKVVTKGTGDKTFNMQAGALGSTEKIIVTATTPDGLSISGSTDVTPSIVGLVWEANTYTPPFYKGKSLRSWGASYTVMAIPQAILGGVSLKPSSLIYTWSKNESVDASVSGYGKDTYQGDGTISYTRGGDDISVTVSTTDGTKVGEADITIPVTQAEIFMYQESPLYGILYNQALTDATLNGDSISLDAEPFFFSNEASVISSLVWSINGNTISAFAGNPYITLSRQDKNAGSSVVSASLQSPFALLQGAQKSVTININAEK